MQCLACKYNCHNVKVGCFFGFLPKTRYNHELMLMVRHVPVPECTLFLKAYLTTSVHVRRILDALIWSASALSDLSFLFFCPGFFFPSDHHASRAQLWSISPLATLSKYTVWCAHLFRARLAGVRNLTLVISLYVSCSDHFHYLHISCI